MKILVIIKWLEKFNGTSRCAYELTKRFQEENDVRIIAYRDHIDPEWEAELNVYKLHHTGILALPEVRKIVREFKPDIIHSHDWLGLLAVYSEAPLVVTTHNHWPYDWFHSLENFLAGLCQGIPHEIEMHLADQVVSVSKFGQSLLEKRSINSEIISHGVDEMFFALTPAAQLEKPSVLLVGGVDKRKLEGLTLLLQHLDPSIHVYICGRISDPNTVNQLQGHDNIHILGFVEDIRPYYRAVDACISVSKFELFGFSIIEAQACGCPVVTFESYAFPEIIINNETGFLIERGNFCDMAEKIHFIISNPSLRMKLGNNAIMHTRENFRWSDKVQQYLRLFMDLNKRNLAKRRQL